MLGAFSPFMRNVSSVVKLWPLADDDHLQHNADTSISQEFYRWPTVAQAARNALDIRSVPRFRSQSNADDHEFSYRLMDYLYTAFHQASTDGTPVVSPLFFKYPNDTNTFPIDLQFLFGPSILVSPVTDENSTSVSIYLPKDQFYDFATLAPVQGHGGAVQLTGVNFTSIPLHIRGGAILPMREKSAMTTKALRGQDFELVVAPGTDGSATGSLYVDDGVSLVQKAATTVSMAFAHGTLSVQGQFGFALGVDVARVRILGQAEAPKAVRLTVGAKTASASFSWDKSTQVLDVAVGVAFKQNFQLKLS
jgi:alpha-glucosidase